MICRLPLLLFAVLVGPWLGAAPLRAAPVDVIATLRVDAVSTGSPFGISGLPAGPFTATLSFAGPLPASANLTTLAGVTAAGLSGFSLTIGNTSFGISGLSAASLQTDAAGLAIGLSVVGFSGARFFELSRPSSALNLEWFAAQTECGFDVFADPLQVSGLCVAGGTGSVSLSQVSREPAAVPAPGALALFGPALVLLAVAARRRV
jgi:hypothetical protein